MGTGRQEFFVKEMLLLRGSLSTPTFLLYSPHRSLVVHKTLLEMLECATIMWLDVKLPR